MSRTIWVACLAIITARFLPGLSSALRDGVYAATFGERYLAYELLGSVFIFAAMRPGRDGWVRSILYGTLIGVLFLSPPAVLRPFPALFALAALLGAGACVAAAENAATKRTWGAAGLFAIMLAPVAFRSVRLWLLTLTPAIMPETQDALLYIFDGAYGIQFSFAVGQLFLHFPALGWAAYRTYIAMPLAITGLYAIWLARQQRGREPQVNILVMTVAMSAAGYLLYSVLPASGPAYLFGTAFPLAVPDASVMSGEPMPLTIADAPRNCMPSLHLAWALMVLLNSRGLPLLMRAVAAVYFSLTALATLGLGEHYLIDLVVAVPFTVLFQGVCNRLTPALDRTRLTLIVWGATATAAWLAFLRFGLPWYRDGRILVWTASIVTIAVSYVLELRLARRGFPAERAGDAAGFLSTAGVGTAVTRRSAELRVQEGQ